MAKFVLVFCILALFGTAYVADLPGSIHHGSMIATSFLVFSILGFGVGIITLGRALDGY